TTGFSRAACVCAWPGVDEHGDDGCAQRALWQRSPPFLDISVPVCVGSCVQPCGWLHLSLRRIRPSTASQLTSLPPRYPGWLSLSLYMAVALKTDKVLIRSPLAAKYGN